MKSYGTCPKRSAARVKGQWPNIIPGDAYVTFCLSVQLLLGPGLVSPLWLFRVVLPWTLVSENLFKCLLSGLLGWICWVVRQFHV